MSKKALLVGINTFTRPDWALRGCINDTIAMRQVLTTYFGFQDEDIRTIQDRDATAQAIRDHLGWLMSDWHGNDVRVFHFSSHGTQVPDDTADEREVQDEVIVPFDHDWNKPLRDDELRTIFDSVPRGVNFTFIADCCHSGSIQRGLLDRDIDFRPRFLTPPPEITDRIRQLQEQREQVGNNIGAAELLQILQNVPREQWEERTAQFLAQHQQKFRENKFAVIPYEKDFLLAACQDRQTAADARIEGEYRGAFTWALSTTIREANGNLTYDDLIAGASAKMKDYTQIPQLECPAGVRTAKLFSPLA